jgi:transcription termination factor Rho
VVAPFGAAPSPTYEHNQVDRCDELPRYRAALIVAHATSRIDPDRVGNGGEAPTRRPTAKPDGTDTWEGPHVTETIDSTTTAPETPHTAAGSKKRSGGLNSMLLADLKAMARGMGIPGAGSMKKAQLVEAIKAAQAGSRNGSEKSVSDGSSRATQQRQEPPPAEQAERPDTERPDTQEKHDKQGNRENRETRENRDQQSNRENRDQQGNRENRDQQANRDRNRPSQGGNQQQGGGQDRYRDDDAGGSRRNRRRRGRDRDRTRQGGGGVAGGVRTEPDTQILEDDVLVPAAGILDVLDNYAFVRTSGYLPGSDDVYLSLSMVRKFGLRRGDAIVGEVRQPREGERKEKFNPMVRVESVNGADPEAAKARVEFSKLTPLYPSERLRLETEATNLIGRVIDIAAPIGKGQRGLIVSPSKAGKTMIMQSIANSITTNNPECHLMVVLVDERPEEVTDFERSVKGEVISSTFDRPASDHTTVAELAIERAKRLVELGHDVVVLLDGITRLGRAYNLAAPASGRILSGGVDSAALYPPKRFFGAARNIENGGSLTILATALIESGSKMDEVIFEEFKGTGNMEIRLRRDFADKRLFPAIDAVQSGTRREELLMSKEELAIVWKLRRVLSALDGQQALELLLERLKKSQSNIEFLMQVQKTTPTLERD